MFDYIIYEKERIYSKTWTMKYGWRWHVWFFLCWWNFMIFSVSVFHHAINYLRLHFANFIPLSRKCSEHKDSEQKFWTESGSSSWGCVLWRLHSVTADISPAPPPPPPGHPLLRAPCPPAQQCQCHQAPMVHAQSPCPPSPFCPPGDCVSRYKVLSPAGAETGPRRDGPRRMGTRSGGCHWQELDQDAGAPGRCDGGQVSPSHPPYQHQHPGQQAGRWLQCAASWGSSGHPLVPCPEQHK